MGDNSDSVLAQYAIFKRTVAENMLRSPGPWLDTGIRASTKEAAYAGWTALPVDERAWQEAELRLVPLNPTSPASPTS